MAVLAQRSRPVSSLTLEQRQQRQKLLVRDALALSSLLILVVVLSFVTYLLFHSFVEQRTKLGQRWRARGEAALAHGHAAAAVNDLRSALEYSPGDETLETELAMALLQAGSTREATVYFDTLHESRPGDGLINLELARLAAAQGNTAQALSFYQASLDGTWNGDGSLRRREARFELARYLISQHRYDDARSQLLVAAGNAADNHGVQIQAAQLLEQAQGNSEAFDLYRRAASFRDTRTIALIGAGRTAASLGYYRVARTQLAQAVAQSDFSKQPPAQQSAARSLLETSENILALYPSDLLPAQVRARRAAHLADLARAGLESCVGSPRESDAVPGGEPLAAAPALPQPATPIRAALGAVVERAQSLAGVRQPANTPAGSPAATKPSLQPLLLSWLAEPTGDALVRQLTRDPDALAPTLALTYQTARSTAQACGPPSSGDAALLLDMARNPDEVEQP